MFVTFEGIDGCGKSSQIARAADALTARGFPVVRTREPGGSPGAEEIRSLILTGDVDRWDAETELLLFNAARRDHVQRVIRPALEKGYVVLCDRFIDTTRVFQGLARADLVDAVDQLHARFIGLEPDLTLLFDMDPEAALRRALIRCGGETRFEDMGLDFQVRARAGFLSLADRFPERVRVIDASPSIEAVQNAVVAKILEALPKNGHRPIVQPETSETRAGPDAG